MVLIVELGDFRDWVEHFFLAKEVRATIDLFKHLELFLANLGLWLVLPLAEVVWKSQESLAIGWLQTQFVDVVLILLHGQVMLVLELLV